MKKTSKKKKTPNMIMTQKIKKTQTPKTKNTPIMNMIPKMKTPKNKDICKN